MSGLPESYDPFLRPPCAQQSSQYAYNTLPPSTPTNFYNYDYMCPPRTNQTFYTDHIDTSTNNWIVDIEKRLKFTDKIEAIEITNKDLSPVSCCSIDPALSNSYNTPYYYNYPSCSQVTNNFTQEYDYNPVIEQFYAQPFVDINQTAECSGESDIVVEDSEGCFSDESQDLNRFLLGNCVVCNVPYTPLGSHFYTLKDKSPLTMSSQHPVYLKLQKILGGRLSSEARHLCSGCLDLINTIDHLQLKLESTKSELLSKFRTGKRSSILKTKFRNFCGLHRFKCKYCKKQFTPAKLFKIHLRKHKLPKRYLCELCGCRFVTPSSLKLHRLTHQPTVPAFICRLCEKPFRTKSNLKEHYSYCSDSYPYECCDKKFTTSSKLKHHRKLKHDKKFVAICSICNVGFVKVSAYKSHKLTHSTEKKYNCTCCGKSYKTAGNLNFHMKVHREKLPFICSVCNKGFMRKEYLEAHVNNHNGVKNYVCQICKKRFVSQKNLDAHVKYHEGSVKTRSCNICNKVVTTGFEEHLRTHSNLKEFQCELCLMKFNTKGALCKHKTRKH